MGIDALAPQPGTSKAAPGNKIYPNRLRKLAIVRANQVWALDTTYIPMAKGFVYLTAVVDVASRRVLTHKVAVTLEACHAREIIEEAFAKFGKPEIVNTDQGSQFTAEEFTMAVLKQGCKLSMDGKGAWREHRVWGGHAREAATRFRGNGQKNPNRIRVGIMSIGGGVLPEGKRTGNSDPRS